MLGKSVAVESPDICSGEFPVGLTVLLTEGGEERISVEADEVVGHVCHSSLETEFVPQVGFCCGMVGEAFVERPEMSALLVADEEIGFCCDVVQMLPLGIPSHTFTKAEVADGLDSHRSGILLSATMLNEELNGS